MPVGGTMSVSHVTDQDVKPYRVFFLLGWVAVIGFLPWLLVAGRPEPVTVQMDGPVPVLVLLSVLSTPLGWFLGWRHLWAPLFAGKIILNENSAVK